MIGKFLYAMLNMAGDKAFDEFKREFKEFKPDRFRDMKDFDERLDDLKPVFLAGFVKGLEVIKSIEERKEHKR